MTDITKLTKKQLLDIIEGYEESKWDDFKEAFGVTYNTDEEWIDFFKSIQESRAVLQKEIVDIKHRQYLIDRYRN
tara:strand:+ start:6629 stop:6853 length:225 start_codon:yes stop_codon:yes gene_type:complete